MFENLSAHRNLKFIKSKDPDKIQKMLSNIHLPFSIVSMYEAGGEHFAWIVSELKIEKIKEGAKNGSSK